MFIKSTCTLICNFYFEFTFCTLHIVDLGRPNLRPKPHRNPDGKPHKPKPKPRREPKPDNKKPKLGTLDWNHISCDIQSCSRSTLYGVCWPTTRPNVTTDVISVYTCSKYIRVLLNDKTFVHVQCVQSACLHLRSMH